MRNTRENKYLKEFKKHILNAQKELLLALRSPFDSLLHKLEKRLEEIEKTPEAKKK